MCIRDSISTGLIDVSISLLETFAYHLFIISFISLGLTAGGGKKENLTAVSPVKGALWIGLMTGVVMAMQGLIASVMVLLLNPAGYNLNPLFGFLAPLGFAQGRCV